MRKVLCFLITLIFIGLFTPFNCSAEDIKEVEGTVSKSAAKMLSDCLHGLIILQEYPDKHFILDRDKSIKLGILKKKGDSIEVAGGLKGQKVKLSYKEIKGKDIFVITINKIKK